MAFRSTVWSEIERARDRDPQAYLHFVNRYRPAVVAYLKMRGFSAEDAEDIAQDVFLDIVKHNVLAKAEPAKGRFRTLLLAVTRNLVAKEWRRRRTRKRDARTVPLEEAVSASEAEEQERFDRAWTQQLLARALRELASENENYYRALSLHLQGRSHKEIAEEMSKSAVEVNNYVHRAKSWISRCLLALISEYCEGDFKEELDHLSKYLPDDRPV
jgi:RNA polymerase sigma-70 factor (ECF subfamily)